MASGWMVHTFDRAQWDLLFGGGMPGAEQKIREALLWGEGAEDEDEKRETRHWLLETLRLTRRTATELAPHLAKDGFTYKGLDGRAAIMLDGFCAGIFDGEVLGEDLDMRGHSRDHISMAVIEELLYRSGNIRSLPKQRDSLVGRVVQRAPARVLPLLLSGRRFGTDMPTRAPHSYYVILSPSEAADLKAEVETAIGAPMAWQRYEEAQPGVTRDCLLEPLHVAVASGRWTAMTCQF